jgi:hypothetical protein
LSLPRRNVTVKNPTRNNNLFNNLQIYPHKIPAKSHVKS